MDSVRGRSLGTDHLLILVFLFVFFVLLVLLVVFFFFVVVVRRCRCAFVGAIAPSRGLVVNILTLSVIALLGVALEISVIFVGLVVLVQEIGRHDDGVEKRNVR